MGQGKRLPVPEDGSGGSQELEKPLAGGSVPCRLGAQQPAQPRALPQEVLGSVEWAQES